MGKLKSEKLARTITAVRAVLKTNPDIPQSAVEDSVGVLVGSRKAVKPSAPAKVERPFTRREVAELLGKSVQTIDTYARSGKLKRITLDGSSRTIGYAAASVRALAEGRTK